MAEETESTAMSLGLPFTSSRQSTTICSCLPNKKARDCRCGEDDQYREWVWDHIQCGNATTLEEDGCYVMFHEDFSVGTAAIRGLQAMNKDQHFWEIKMASPVYGTDMMIGVGTSNVELNKFHTTFCSMLGSDMDSWAISYDGHIQHAGKKQKYCGKFGPGTIIGVHLDMWHGTMTFYKNRQCLGVAFKGLAGRTLYPMASSTAARTGMRVISARSFPSSLQFLCCQKLRHLIPGSCSMLDVLPLPPGLRLFLDNNMAWLLRIPLAGHWKPTLHHTRVPETRRDSVDCDHTSGIQHLRGCIFCTDSDETTNASQHTQTSDGPIQQNILSSASSCSLSASEVSLSTSSSVPFSASSSAQSSSGWTGSSTRKRKIDCGTNDEVNDLEQSETNRNTSGQEHTELHEDLREGSNDGAKKRRFREL